MSFCLNTEILAAKGFRQAIFQEPGDFFHISGSDEQKFHRIPLQPHAVQIGELTVVWFVQHVVAAGFGIQGDSGKGLRVDAGDGYGAAIMVSHCVNSFRLLIRCFLEIIRCSASDRNCFSEIFRSGLTRSRPGFYSGTAVNRATRQFLRRYS